MTRRKTSSRKQFQKSARPKKRTMRWDLSHGLYKSLEDPALKVDMEDIENEVNAFVGEYEDTVANLSGEALGEGVRTLERIETKKKKPSLFLQLKQAEDSRQIDKTKNLETWLEKVEGKLEFFTDEISKMKNTDLIAKTHAKQLHRYGPWLATLRPERKKEPAEEVTTLLAEYEITNITNWIRLYHTMIEETKVVIAGETMLADIAGSKLDDWQKEFGKEEVDKRRQIILEALEPRKEQAAIIYNAIARGWAIYTKAYGHNSVEDYHHHENNITIETFNKMMSVMEDSMPQVAHRFYDWQEHRKEEQEKNFQKGIHEEVATYTWDEACTIVIRAMNRFSPKGVNPHLGRLTKKFFDTKHIDAEPRLTKKQHPFTSDAVPGHMPFVVSHFRGEKEQMAREVGHESAGHAINQYLSGKKQGLFLGDPTHLVAETIALFTEHLVTDEMLRTEKNPNKKRDILEDHIEGIIRGAYYYASRHRFEQQAHQTMQKKNLDAEKISDLWINTQRDMKGPAVEPTEYDRYKWLRMDSLFEDPLSNYKYCFAQLISNVLYIKYEEAEAAGEGAKVEFFENYIEFNSMGNTKNIEEALHEYFDIDITDPQTWQSGVDFIAERVDGLVKEMGLDTAPVTKKPRKKRPLRRRNP